MNNLIPLAGRNISELNSKDIANLDMCDPELLMQLGIEPLPEFGDNLNDSQKYTIMKQMYLKQTITSSMVDAQHEEICSRITLIDKLICPTASHEFDVVTNQFPQAVGEEDDEFASGSWTASSRSDSDTSDDDALASNFPNDRHEG